VLAAITHDRAGNQSTHSASVTVDNIAPVVAITAPTEGAVLSGPSVLVSATASDANGISGVQFKLDGADLGALDTTSPYQVTWSSPTDGAHILTAIAQDNAGHSTTATSVSVTVGSGSPPVVALTAPAEGALLAGSSILVSAVASDASGIVGVQFLLDGVDLGPMDTSNDYEATWSNPTDGPHVLSAIARDAAGHTTTAASVSVVVDNTDPVTTLTAPTGGSIVSGTAVAVSATATDNDVVVGVQFKLNGANLGSEDTTAPYELAWNSTTATDGLHALAASTRDRAGHQTTSTVSVTVDNTLPTVAVTAPADGAVLTGASVAVNATASDASGIASVQFKLDGVNLGTADTQSPYQVTWSSPTNGSHVLTAVATDNAGNARTATNATVVIDNILPVATVTSPANGGRVSGASVPVTATATDNDAIAGVQFKLDGANLGTEDTTAPYGVTWNSTTATNASHVVAATARDRAGNQSTHSVTVTVDNILPTVSVTAPTNGAVLRGTTVNVTANASDAQGIAGVQFKLDGANLGALDTASPYQVTWSNPTDGSHVLTAVATDNSGNVATATNVTVTVDNTLPVVNITAPANGAVLTGATVTVNATATDARGITGVQFMLDGANLGALDNASPYTRNWSGPTAGTHVLTAVATDNSGNVPTAPNITVTIDTSAPPATAAIRDGTTATDAQYTNLATQLSANWDAVTDVGSGVAYYQMAIGTNSGGSQTMAYTNVGNVLAYTKTGLSLTNRLYYISVRAVDLAGNVGAVRTSNGILVDTTLPTVSLSAPANNATVSGTAVVISANASDTNGIVSVQFTLDNVNIGAADTTSPYSITWNSTTATNGTHTLRAVARDSAGNIQTSASRNITVSN
jgi:hypothetical protein